MNSSDIGTPISIVACARMLPKVSCGFSCKFRSPKNIHRNLLIDIYDGCVPVAPLSNKGHKGQKSGRRKYSQGGEIPDHVSVRSHIERGALKLGYNREAVMFLFLILMRSGLYEM